MIFSYLQLFKQYSIISSTSIAKSMNPKVDPYFTEGCGRCPLGGTPACKVNLWPQALAILRNILLDCGLHEVLKWGVPCYTFRNSNVLILAAFKDYCAVSFFKGALLADADGILDKPGTHTQAARLIKFTDAREITQMEPILKAYIFEAIEVEKAGLIVTFQKDTEIVFPDELQQVLDEDTVFKSAFEALTPGRQRAYMLYFSAAKQSPTRISRIEKCMAQIFKGKGLND
jgi:uncharacterized protein YdeI (YjbR/CyaY-like superfamily)